MKNKKQYTFLFFLVAIFSLAFFSVSEVKAEGESLMESYKFYTSEESLPNNPTVKEQYMQPLTGGDPNFLQERIASECDLGFEKIAGVCIPTQERTGLSEQGILDILANFLSWMFALFAILAVGAFVLSGIQYLAAAGNSGLAETAKKNATWALIGIIVGLSGFLILKAVSAALSGSSIF
ncbi:MAG: hypothetical protein ACD_11C00054G0024 [uncultured bacterium]|nr:MAG: hypothetical protein ACD_11C00054G0024 [uncultured bacterium]